MGRNRRSLAHGTQANALTEPFEDSQFEDNEEPTFRFRSPLRLVGPTTVDVAWEDEETVSGWRPTRE